ncbi:MAG: hypothetical protein WCO00_17245 [Rhodospirillaceae bacterium]
MAGERARRSVRRLAWLAAALVLSLAFMPLHRLPPAAPGHHHAAGPAASAPAGGEAGHAGRGGLAKGCEGTAGCPFCTAHPGYSPPPPQMAALPVPAGFALARLPAVIEAAATAPEFLTSLRPRAPPAAAV